MDCFYAAVEMRDNPAYRDVPIAVGFEGPRSVLCTCNYHARAFGVRSAMPAMKAKQLCPDLVIVNTRMNVYQEASKQIRAIFHQYTDLVEPLSLDEAFLDVTDCDACSGSATLIAEEIRQKIFQQTQLTASAGVAPNKFLAKIASDENKPNGQCVITPNDVGNFVANLPLKKIPGIGPKTAEKYAQHGLNTCADIRQCNELKLRSVAGNFAETLYKRSCGIDDRPVETHRERKSLAIETTLGKDLTCVEDCVQVVDDLIPKLMTRLEKITDRKIVRQGIKLKFSDFNQTTVEKSSLLPDRELFISLLKTAYARGEQRPVRLIGLTLGFAKLDNQSAQLELPID